MGHPLLKDIADMQQYKPAYEGLRIPNWRDWVKRENPEELILGYLEVSLGHIMQRIDAVEQHIANPAGRAFIRGGERPQVGGDMLQQIAEPIKMLTERLDNIEKRLSSNRAFDGASGGASGEQSK